MTSLSPTPVVNSKPPIQLIPWDPTSPEHVHRMVKQRIACGWDIQAVEGWRTDQETGKRNLQWIVLDDSDPEKDTKLLKHAQAFPEEQEPLLDSALSFGGKLRTIPSPQRNFIPIGHISLSQVPREVESGGYLKNEEGLYWIGPLYVSRALQGTGLGRATMDTIENLAISAPLFAKTLALDAISKVDPEREEKYKALGLTIPLFSNQEWYERRGYEVFNTAEKLFSHVDSTGKTWSWNAVFLKKDI